MNNNVLYYEAHVTIEPVFEKRLDEFVAICKKFDFRVADLLMKKRKEDLPERSSYDSFCTGRSINYHDLYTRMEKLVGELALADFVVWRYKLESTLLDVKMKHSI